MSPPRDKTACQTSPCKCKICISSVESDVHVYNKKKIQMFVMNMTFISSREVKKCIFHSCLRHSWNIHFFTSLDEISHIHDKHLNFLFIIYMYSWSEKMYISFVPSALMKYTFFHFTQWNKSYSLQIFEHPLFITFSLVIGFPGKSNVACVDKYRIGYGSWNFRFQWFDGHRSRCLSWVWNS